MLNRGYALLDRSRGALLKKMGKAGPFIMATPTYLKVRCGNPGCKCAKRKEDRHEKLHLSWTDAEGDGTCYVPVDLRKEVLEWVENYWTIKEYLKQMTDLSRKMIKIYAQTVGKHKRKMSRKASEAKI
jgi:hypothetical protein